MTKLIVVIPAYNEEQNVAEVVRSVPRSIPGIDRVSVLVYDDGSTDRTSEEAREAGADYILRHSRNRGLAVTFRDALDAALHLGAHVIVNTDGDNHYDQSRIPELVEPIIAGQADIVIGSRDLAALNEMGFIRKWGNRAASWIFRFLYRLPDGTDVSSGFRAYSREAALRLTITSKYTYAHESLIVAKDHNLVIASRVFAAKDVTRPSRLMTSVGSHIYRAGTVAVLSFAVHRLFHMLGNAAHPGRGCGLPAFFLLCRYLWGSGPRPIPDYRGGAGDLGDTGGAGELLRPGPRQEPATYRGRHLFPAASAV
jgi:glycosyltransferase involved in cell wall biosynthesis